MNRKHFLQSGAGLLAASVVSSTPVYAKREEERGGIIPPYLRKGDTIGIVSPAGYITVQEIQPALQLIENWGYKVRIGSSIGKRDFTFGGTDDDRAADLQQMMDDAGVNAVLCARGGYGAVRIIDRLKWERFRQHPKWIIGFSDITVIHSHLNRQLGVASIHSKMCNSFPDNWAMADALQKDTIESIRRALEGERLLYRAPANPLNLPGTVAGVLVGGNLKTLESLAGSASDINTKGKILFVEDTGEYPYSVDRMFWNLQRSGKLQGLAALIVGGFKLKPDDPGEEFGKGLHEIVLEKVRKYGYPVCFDFPVGHQRNNFALKCGVRHKLQVQAAETVLMEE